MSASRVAVIRAQPETASDDVARALRLVEPRARRVGAEAMVVVEGGDRVPLAVATPWALAGAIRHLEGRAPRIAVRGIRDGSTGSTALDRVLARAGVAADPIDVEGSAPIDVELPWLRGRRGTDLRVDARAKGRDVIWTGTLVHDPERGPRGATEGFLSCVARDDELAERDPQTWLEALRLAETVFPGRRFLLDATICPGVTPGQRPQVHNLLLAGRDPVVLDAVAARLLGYDPARIPWLRALADSMRRPLESGAIEVVGGIGDGGRRADWLHATGRPSRPVPTRSRALRWARSISPGRVRAVLDARRWRALRSRTPWGRLHDDYVRSGPPRGEMRS